MEIKCINDVIIYSDIYYEAVKSILYRYILLVRCKIVSPLACNQATLIYTIFFYFEYLLSYIKNTQT